MRSRLCVRQFKAEGLSDDLFAGTPDTFFIKYLLANAANCKDFGLLVVDICVAFTHARTDEEIYVKVPSGIKSSRFWRLKAAVNGTRKASEHWQEFSCDKLLTNICFSIPTERHKSVYLQPFLRQFGLGTAQRRFSGVWINIQVGSVGG